MNITLTGIPIIGFAVLACCFYPARLLQAIVFFSSFSATAVINFSNYGMSPCAVLFPSYLIWKAISGDARRSVQVSRDHLMILGLIVWLLTISVVSLLMNQATREVAPFETTQTAYAAFGILVTIIMSIDFAHEDRLDYAIGALRAGAVFIALWGLVQAACYYAHIPYPADLFNNTSSHSNDMFDQRAAGGLIIRIASVTVEPSFMAVSLLIFGSFGSTLLVSEPRLHTTGWIASVGLVMLVVAASTSSTAYVGMVVLALLLVWQQPRLVIGWPVIITVVVVLLAILASMVFPAFQAAIYEMTLGKTSGGSYAERSQTVITAIRLIPEKPWIGWGWGGVVTYSIAPQLLTNIGALGTACFLFALVGTLVASHAARKNSNPADWRLRAYAKGTENAMIVFMAQSLAAGFHFVVADFWLLWAFALAIPSCLTSRRRDAPLPTFHQQRTVIDGVS